MLILFHSWQFILFFMVIFCIYWISPQRFKNPLLLAGSIFFYASWNWKLFIVLLGSIGVDYYCGLKIDRAQTPKAKKYFLLVSIIFNLTILGFFKYYNFFVENLRSLLHLVGLSTNLTTLSIILPLGISFHTFQKLSYIIDIYKGETKPTKNFLNFALFVIYFPQLFAGPIERAKNLLPGLQAEKFFRNVNFGGGVYLFLYGLFKKVVIADSIAIIVDSIYLSVHPTGTQVVIATYAFALQIYCDFSAYSEMVKGISHLLGVELSTNFNLPYLAKNPSDFWRRWHMTLSSWVRDYIYIPLGGSYTFMFGLMPLFVTFFLIGFWHGAAWNFILWGLYWFAATMIYRITQKWFGDVKIVTNKFVSFIYSILVRVVMFQVVCYGWILFRAKNLSQIINFTQLLMTKINITEIMSYQYVYLYILFFLLIVYEVLLYYKKDLLFIPKQNFYIQMIFYLVLFFIYVEVGSVSNVAFLYFQF